ncbi:hypothetical protein ACVST5_19755 [Yersinia enterocolitica]|uniref:hypothetical protein n=1 Tax=Yersinia enterocolitica TaxID=630 RepID=UPI001CA58101|nr:hypothetical protein [Yersinia enterocolitica]MBW5833884.1 hypothetical protein [Yersinia enterocolitica]MBX9476948.1 hypothetical protein [Yersinia enterocolitica]MBX9489552.1 hypothetical protein [Yersinia enterocolitica]MBX9494288.1 hypothetical protein [Yersinia enterocolitica]
MSDPAGTILNLLSSLTSARAAFKAVVTGLILFFAWKYLPTIMQGQGLMSEQYSIIILLLGIGSGVLVSEALLLVGSKVKEVKQKRNHKKFIDIEKKELIENQDKKITNFLTTFKNTYQQRPLEQITILRTLSKGDNSLSTAISNRFNTGIVDATIALKKNDLIRIVTNIDAYRAVYTLNPIIINFIKEQWNDEVLFNVNAYLEDISKTQQLALDALKESTLLKYIPELPHIPLSVYEGRYTLTPCLQIECFDDSNNTGYISFGDGYFEAFSEKLGIEFQEEVEVQFIKLGL